MTKEETLNINQRIKALIHDIEQMQGNFAALPITSHLSSALENISNPAKPDVTQWTGECNNCQGTGISGYRNQTRNGIVKRVAVLCSCTLGGEA